MTKLKRLDLLLVIMALITLAIGGAALSLLYTATLEKQRQRLAEALHLYRPAWEETLSRETIDLGMEAIATALIQRLDEDAFRNLGPAGRLRLIRWTDEGAETLWLTRPPPLAAELGVVHPLPAAFLNRLRQSPAWDEKSFHVREETGTPVLAVFSPLSHSGYGIAAEIELAALRAPFIETAVILAFIGLFLIAVGAFIFFAVTDPIIQRVRHAEARFRGMFENMRWGAAVCQPQAGGDFILANINRRAAEMDRVDRRQVTGQTVTDVLPWTRKTGLVEAMRRVSRLGQSEHVPALFVAGNGGGTWREAYVYKLPTGEIVTLYDDISQRKRAEEDLRESEARWRSIIEMQAVAVVIVDKNLDIRYVNRAAETLFGKSAHELVGAPFGCPVTPKDVADIEIIRPDRGVVYAEMRAILMRSGGEELHLLFIQDVSAHKRAEGDLRKLFQAIEQSPSSVVITDVQGRIEYVNPKFTEVTGYTYPEVVGKNPSILKSGQMAAADYKQLWETISAGKVWRGEFLNKKKSGELFWELTAIAPVRDVSGKVAHYVAVKQDITDRKITEEQLRIAQRLEVIGQLTGGIAHDFNNLLGIIVGNLQLLQEKPGFDPESRELISDAIWSAERGAQLTHRLLAFARRQRLRPRMLNLNEVVSEMTELLRRTLGETIEIRELLAADLWQTRIDRGQLESALLNLVVNARDAMPDGGMLTIATENATLPRDSEPKLTEVTPGDYVMISVSDTGTGMPEEVLERIFEPFFTTKKVGQGSGLGLSMVYGFVRQSEGQISVTSREGEGTTVRMFLPRAERTKADLPEATSRPRTGKALPGETILVVEDDDRVRRTAINILKRNGYRVLSAATAEEALAIAGRESRVDLLFTDVVLPNGLDGPSLALRVQSTKPGARVLLTSGYAADLIVGDGTVGPMDLLPKPYRQEELTQKVREVLDRTAA